MRETCEKNVKNSWKNNKFTYRKRNE